MDDLLRYRKRSCYFRKINMDDLAERKMAFDWVQKENVRKWFDFGDGRNVLSEGQFAFLVRNPANRVHLYCDTDTGVPVGIMALQGVRNAARTAMQWGLRGNLRAGSRMVHRGCHPTQPRNRLRGTGPR